MGVHKTVPWRHVWYKTHLDEANSHRQEIANEVELDLSAFNP